MQIEPIPAADQIQAIESAVQSMIESSTVFASVCLSINGDFISANPAFLKLVGYDSPLELADLDFRTDVLLDAADWEHWRRAANGERVSGVEIPLKGKASRSITLLGDIALEPAHGAGGAGLVAVFVNISESNLVQAALQHAARSEAVTSLTSGMVHDFKNLLTVLVGNLYLVAEGVRDKPELFEQAKRARDVARRGADLTRNLLSLSRQDGTEQQTLDLRRVVGNLKPMLEHSIGSRISLECEIAEDVGSIEVNAAQLESAIVNLVINARDAIEDSGAICISAGNVAVEAGDAARFGIASGDYVQISVRDDGPGIPKSVQARVFEPFYSTKDKDRGTGLGLSMVRWFAESCGGVVRLESAEGQGTKISLFLPSTNEMPQDSALLTMPLKSLPAGDENVLVIAREQDLATTLCDSLAVLGYQVTTSADGSDIFGYLNRQTYQLLILDSSAFVWSRLVHLEKAIQQRFPLLKLIVLSSPADTEASAAELDSSLLTKPFTLKDLASKVRVTLDGEPNDG